MIFLLLFAACVASEPFIHPTAPTPVRSNPTKVTYYRNEQQTNIYTRSRVTYHEQHTKSCTEVYSHNRHYYARKSPPPAPIRISARSPQLAPNAAEEHLKHCHATSLRFSREVLQFYRSRRMHTKHVEKQVKKRKEVKQSLIFFLTNPNHSPSLTRHLRHRCGCRLEIHSAEPWEILCFLKILFPYQPGYSSRTP
jgi:hypothetical protein